MRPRALYRPSPNFLWGVLIAAMVGVLTAAGVSFLQDPSSGLKHQASVLPVYGQLPDFSLTDQSSNPFGLQHLLGRPWIADFIFTSCAGQCPTITEQMRQLQRRLPTTIHLVSITVDPKRDTPQALSRYAQSLGADQNRWTFLTGEPEVIATLTSGGFRLSYAEGGSPQEPITHSVKFVLVDAEGKIRGYYDATDRKATARLARDALGLTR